MKIAVIVAATALTLALAIGWIRPDATVAPFIAAAFLLARVAVAVLGARRRDPRGPRSGPSTPASEDRTDEVAR